MKRLMLAILAGFCALSLFPQQLQHVTGVTNVEVPVRVYAGDKFVDSLTLNDFEVLEDGVPQKVVASYLIKKTDILRREENQTLEPRTNRTFYLFFEIYEYLPRLREAITFFVKNVLGPRDDLMLVTSMESYSFKRGILTRLSRDQVIDQMNGIVRMDTVTGNTEYRHTLNDLKIPAKKLSAIFAQGDPSSTVGTDAGIWGGLRDSEGEVQNLLEEYRAGLARLDSMRTVDEKKIMDFARILKQVEGQKYVFLFYQREFLPLLDKKILSHYLDNQSETVQMTMRELFSYQTRRPAINAEAIKRAYSDSSIAIHFLYLTTSPEQTPGISFEEHSEDIFTPFLEIAEATGGLTESTSNPQFAMQKAAEASENYYILYYAPANSRADGKFKKISVKVKGQGYRVTNRSGYFAN